MSPHRYRWGAAAWLLTLQFFVVETVAAARSEVAYSRADDAIGSLGAATFPAHQLMNASLVVQAGLVLGGLLLLRPALRGTGARVAVGSLGAAALGLLLSGVFPQDTQPTLHDTGTWLLLIGGGIGLIGLAYAVRPRSEVLGTSLAVLGLVGTATTVFFLTGVTGYLGAGGTERTATYVLPIGLAIAGPALWWLATRREDDDAERPSRQQVREQARAEQAERNRARDEALEAAARRREAARNAGAAQPGSTSPEETEPADDFDPDDPWAPRRRRDA
ncbi:MAG TPA: DUF998 domain-containing protein [Geodermatophilus sp.]|nr:DUF998 domain-containing protein [Geodermatophilus sp.]